MKELGLTDEYVKQCKREVKDQQTEVGRSLGIQRTDDIYGVLETNSGPKGFRRYGRTFPEIIPLEAVDSNE